MGQSWATDGADFCQIVVGTGQTGNLAQNRSGGTAQVLSSHPRANPDAGQSLAGISVAVTNLFTVAASHGGGDDAGLLTQILRGKGSAGRSSGLIRSTVLMAPPFLMPMAAMARSPLATPLTLGLADDTGLGSVGQDLVVGNQGRDRLSGGNGAVLLDGATGRNGLAGGAGRDTLAVLPRDGPTASPTLTPARPTCPAVLKLMLFMTTQTASCC